MIRLLALILWLIPWALTAQINTASKAAEIARGFMGGSRISYKSQIVEDSVFSIGTTNNPTAFVVTFNPVGFVIVSTQQSDIPVLGYSLTSAFPANPNHPLRSWLLASYVEFATSTTPQTKGQYSAFFTDQMVLPLISAQWGQGTPWNQFCPEDSTGKRALVGCVAVAMAQIMEKWQWPPKGTGEVTYTPMQRSDYGEISANFDTTNYHWNLTHDTYPTETAALVLFHAGVASLMNYDPSLSSTSVDRYAVPAMVNNFSFNRGLIFRQMIETPAADWIRMLHQELDNSRPVLYAGTSPDGKSSHAFNVDGYRNETYFHFNWGWNGAGDGWYTLNGMAGGGADFSTQQGAIFGLQPDFMLLHDRPSALDVLAGDGFVQLFWERPVISDFSHFSIYRNDSLIGQSGNTSFRDINVENNRRYEYKVSASYGGQNQGESIATPAIEVVPYSRIKPRYTQNFEAGTAGWQLLSSESGFQIGAAALFQIGSNSGKIAAIRSEGHEAGEQVSDYLISPVFYPGDFAHPAVSFDYLFKQNPGIDKLTLLWRDFTTGKWQTLASLDSTGGYSDWQTKHFYLPIPPGSDLIQIAFRYNDNFGQGFGAAIDNFTIYEIAEPAIPKILTDKIDLCLNQVVTFEDKSTGLIQTWEWDFGEGAEPRFATTQGPHQVFYSITGKKVVKLSLNHIDHLVVPDALFIREHPEAGYEYSRRSLKITFTNKSKHAENLLWVFGDGTTSDQAEPVHTYPSKDLYEVKQIAYNGTCQPDTAKGFIDLRMGTGIDEDEPVNRLRIYPNPTSGKLTLLWNTLSPKPLKIRILSASGQVFQVQEYPPLLEINLNLSDFPDGIYILQIASEKLIRNEQIIKINNH